MKRTIRRLALVLALVLALSAAAMAKELDYTATNAQENVHAASLVDGCELKFDGDKLNVTYTNSALKEGDMVIVFLLETDDKQAITDDKVELSITPTSSNIKYIDQSVAKATASNGSVTFDIYPQNHTNAVVRIISVNKDGTLTDENVAAVKLNYKLGDVNGDGNIDSRDAMAVLLYAVNGSDDTGKFALKVRQAANVNFDNQIDSRDALRILLYAVNGGEGKYAFGK